MFTLSRNDAVRVRFALHSAALSMVSKPEAQEPGSRVANEIHEVNSILSRFIAMIESTNEGDEFEIIPKASNGTRRNIPVAKRLPGLGGESYAGKQGTGKAASLQLIEGTARESDRASVPTKKQAEERET